MSKVKRLNKAKLESKKAIAPAPVVEQKKAFKKSKAEPQQSEKASTKKSKEKAPKPTPEVPDFFKEDTANSEAAEQQRKAKNSRALTTPLDGELFGRENVASVDEDWQGWRKLSGTTGAAYFRDFGYFKQYIKLGEVKTLEEATQHATMILTTVNDFHLGARNGDRLDNSFMRLFGCTEEEFKDEQSEALYKMLVRVWNVGNAEHLKMTKEALFKKAEGGDLEAQKTLLKDAGLLKENATKGSGSLHLTFDSVDADA